MVLLIPARKYSTQPNGKPVLSFGYLIFALLSILIIGQSLRDGESPLNLSTTSRRLHLGPSCAILLTPADPPRSAIVNIRNPAFFLMPAAGRKLRDLLGTFTKAPRLAQHQRSLLVQRCVGLFCTTYTYSFNFKAPVEMFNIWKCAPEIGVFMPPSDSPDPEFYSALDVMWVERTPNRRCRFSIYISPTWDDLSVPACIRVGSVPALNLPLPTNQHSTCHPACFNFTPVSRGIPVPIDSLAECVGQKPHSMLECGEKGKKGSVPVPPGYLTLTTTAPCICESTERSTSSAQIHTGAMRTLLRRSDDWRTSCIWSSTKYTCGAYGVIISDPNQPGSSVQLSTGWQMSTLTTLNVRHRFPSGRWNSSPIYDYENHRRYIAGSSGLTWEGYNFSNVHIDPADVPWMQVHKINLPRAVLCIASDDLARGQVERRDGDAEREEGIPVRSLERRGEMGRQGGGVGSIKRAEEGRGRVEVGAERVSKDRDIPDVEHAAAEVERVRYRRALRLHAAKATIQGELKQPQRLSGTSTGREGGRRS
ncbi:hypothetical protein C8R44DRAFT_739005 [Mycena epipterygia]|nr:hypothetical protein C8R44DRAFT_739005 [Mycena epipterygia]